MRWTHAGLPKASARAAIVGVLAITPAQASKVRCKRGNSVRYSRWVRAASELKNGN